MDRALILQVRRSGAFSGPLWTARGGQWQVGDTLQLLPVRPIRTYPWIFPGYVPIGSEGAVCCFVASRSRLAAAVEVNLYGQGCATRAPGSCGIVWGLRWGLAGPGTAWFRTYVKCTVAACRRLMRPSRQNYPGSECGAAKLAVSVGL